MSDSPEQDPTTNGKVGWTISVERMLVRWCDQAKCFEWMHTETYQYCDTRSKAIMIASNVLTAIAGLSNVIAGGSTVGGFQLAWAFGSLSILVSIANMLQEKLAYTTKATEHRQYSIQWGTVRRKIDEELSIPPESRKDCGTFLKYLRQDINQVSMDGNTKLPEFVRDACNEKFSKIPDFDIPDICGQMEHTQGYSALV